MSLRVNAPTCPLSADGVKLVRTLLLREQELKDAREAVERATAGLEQADRRQREAYQAVCDAHPADETTRVCMTLPDSRAVYLLTLTRNSILAELLPGVPGEVDR